VEAKIGQITIIGNAESEFFVREFKAKWVNKDLDYLDKLKKLIDQGVHPIVQVGSSSAEVDDLKIFPNRSISVMLYADETYQPKINKQIASCHSIHSVIRPYPIWKFSLNQVFRWSLKAFAEFYATCRLTGLKDSTRFTFAGLEMLRRQLVISLRFKLAKKCLLNINLGYTDTFANNYIQALSKYEIPVLDGTVSLFAIALNNKDILFNLKSSKISFMGQQGNSERRLAVTLLETYPGARVFVRNHFKGGLDKLEQRRNSIEFLNECFQNLITLCPPGNFSGLSFRISEALCAGSFPLTVSNSQTDPLFRGFELERNGAWRVSTWRNSLKQILSKDPLEIMNLWESEIRLRIKNNAKTSARLRILVGAFE